jgi:dihydrodipicolinate synthase/N-acetylneuraminate lyase
MEKMNGILPVPMCKYWGELMGMAGGNVRPPLVDLSEDERDELKRDILAVGHDLP